MDFVPRDLASWTHRFDDPKGLYRTLYCAEHRDTCFLEVFYSKRPDWATIEDIATTYGCSIDEARQKAGVVAPDEVLTRSIAPARIEIESGEVLAIEDLALRSELESEHRKELDISVLRSKDRTVTQKLGRSLFEKGAAGVVYGSRVVDSRSIALFEGRARLIPDGEPQPLKDVLDELRNSLKKIDLTLPF